MTGMEPAVAMAMASAATTGVSMVQAQQQAKAQSRAAGAQARQQLQAIEQSRQIEERKARDALRRKSAAQRARFGASGLVSSRSADAILAGLQRETEQRLADSRAMDDLQISGLTRQTSQAQSQIRSNNRFAMLDGLGSITSGFARTSLIKD